MATIDPKQNIAPTGFMGMDPTEMQRMIAQNPQLAEALGKSFEADLMSDQFGEMANAPIQGSRDGVGPYGMTVATPWSALAGGAERVAGRIKQREGMQDQRAGNEALIRALGNTNFESIGPGSKLTEGAPPPPQMGHPGMMGEVPIQPPPQPMPQPPQDPAQAQPQPMPPEQPMADPQAMPPAGGGPMGGPNPMVPPMPNPGGTAAGMPEPGMEQMPVAQPPGPAGRPGGAPPQGTNVMDMIAALRGMWSQGQGPTGR